MLGPAGTRRPGVMELPPEALGVVHRYRWTDGERVHDADLIVDSADRWASYPESASPLWSAWFHGGLVLALRLVEGPAPEGRPGKGPERP